MIFLMLVIYNTIGIIDGMLITPLYVHPKLLKIRNFPFIRPEMHIWTHPIHTKMHILRFIIFYQNMVRRYPLLYYLGVFEDASSKRPLKSFYRYWKRGNYKRELFQRCISRNLHEWFQSSSIILTL